MDFAVNGGRLDEQRTGCIVVGVYEGGKPSAPALELDAASRDAVAAAVRRGDLDGELGTTLLLAGIPNAACERVLLVGLGPEQEFIESSYHAALGAATKTLRTTGAADATLCLDELRVNGRECDWKIEQAVLAVMDGLYRFDQLKSAPPKSKQALDKVVFHVADRSKVPAAEAAVHRALAIADGIVLAKDLGNLPGNVCTPTYLAERARELGRQHGLEVKILDRKDIEHLGMNAFLAVASGSRQPPKLIVMEYHGSARDAQPVVLVGKGITFDTGGLSIKSNSDMEQMKFDMCGAASVLGALHAAALMKLPLDVVGIVPATENMPDGNAMKPGDVVTTMSGQTVEIIDTDSEGRLVLADALTYAERYAPAVVVDVATLTGRDRERTRRGRHRRVLQQRGARARGGRGGRSRVGPCLAHAAVARVPADVQVGHRGLSRTSARPATARSPRRASSRGSPSAIRGCTSTSRERPSKTAEDKGATGRPVCASCALPHRPRCSLIGDPWRFDYDYLD
jgi:leucyl aminopeptidase